MSSVGSAQAKATIVSDTRNRPLRSSAADDSDTHVPEGAASVRRLVLAAMIRTRMMSQFRGVRINILHGPHSVASERIPTRISSITGRPIHNHNRLLTGTSDLHDVPVSWCADQYTTWPTFGSIRTHPNSHIFDNWPPDSQPQSAHYRNFVQSRAFGNYDSGSGGWLC